MNPYLNIDMIFATIGRHKMLLLCTTYMTQHRPVQGSRTCQAAIDARGLSVEVPGRLKTSSPNKPRLINCGGSYKQQ